jgi:hypothetical protein
VYDSESLSSGEACSVTDSSLGVMRGCPSSVLLASDNRWFSRVSEWIVNYRLWSSSFALVRVRSCNSRYSLVWVFSFVNSSSTRIFSEMIESLVSLSVCN